MATEKKTKKDNNKYNKIILAIFVLLLLLIGGTYAWITVTLHSEKTNTIVTGTLSLTLDEHEYIDLSNQKVAIPLSKTDALKQDNNILRSLVDVIIKIFTNYEEYTTRKIYISRWI